MAYEFANGFTNSTSRIPQSAGFSQSAVETAILVNASNPTIVGLWDLQKPVETETAKRVSLAGNLESLGPEGDRRVKAVDERSGGKSQYKAICKLFMAYTHGRDEFIGTGWLIGNDMIATAGHCLYEWKYKGGCLSYIKCYFGYNGPQSVGLYRWGVAAALPAEFLKAPSVVHDVGFIRLNQSVQGIMPIQYSTTPKAGKAQLGVVGYPGDVDFGHYLYEHWATVNINLAKTENLLSYEIDTTPGDSGAPVLRLLPDGQIDAIGVHVTGGFPNIGSTIGPIGNRFEEYILAMNVKAGYKTTSVTVVPSDSGTAPAPGFEMFSIKPNHKESGQRSPPANSSYSGLRNLESAAGQRSPPANSSYSGLRNLESAASQRSPPANSSYLGLRNLESVTGQRSRPASSTYSGLRNLESVAALHEFEDTLNLLYGRKQAKEPPGLIASGVLTQFPANLVLRSLETGTEPPPVDFDRAIANAKQQDDVQTVFFVNFPLELQGQALMDQQELMSSVQSWQAWSSTLCEGSVQQQVDAKALPADSKGQFARSTYRAKVFDTLFRKSTWFAKTFAQDMSKHLETKQADFHSEILTKVLEGYSIPSTVFANLEKVLKQISHGITLSSSTGSDPQQYWIMLTKYNYQSVSQTVQTIVRVIRFEVSQQARVYSSNKSSYKSVSFDLLFSQYQADFNNDIYSKIRKNIDQKLIDDGMDLVNQKSILVPV